MFELLADLRNTNVHVFRWNLLWRLTNFVNPRCTNSGITKFAQRLGKKFLKYPKSPLNQIQQHTSSDRCALV